MAKNIISNSTVRRITAAAVILVVIIIASSIGYHVIEGMNFFEGFYMAFITITTIGFSEVNPLSTAGRILTVVTFITGWAAISYIASLGTQLLFESKILMKRTMARKIGKMNKHYIVCGYGRIGHRIVELLNEADIPVVVVENRQNKIERIQDDGFLFVNGDAQDEETLKEAGIERAKGIICTLSADRDNVFVTLIAREINEDIFVVVRTNQRSNTRKILRAGADKVISPYDVGADRMANVILRPRVNRFINRLTGSEQDHVFDEVQVFEGAQLAGKTLAEANIRREYFVIIIAIMPHDDHEIVFSPGRNDSIDVGDSLIVLGEENRIRQLRQKGCNDHRELSERVFNYELSDLMQGEPFNLK